MSTKLKRKNIPVLLAQGSAEETAAAKKAKVQVDKYRQNMNKKIHDAELNNKQVDLDELKNALNPEKDNDAAVEDVVESPEITAFKEEIKSLKEKANSLIVQKNELIDQVEENEQALIDSEDYLSILEKILPDGGVEVLRNDKKGHTDFQLNTFPNPKYFDVTKQLECRICSALAREMKNDKLKHKAGVYCLQCFFLREQPICIGMCSPCFDKHKASFEPKPVKPAGKKHVREQVIA